jgi:carbon monoxide dehydrogenase subunit G
VAQATYATTARLPVETVWDFVREMDNWARFVTGYQSHEKQSETESLWTLKGDVGVLSRTLTFRVHISEWAGPERVRFELTGVNEPMTGSGTFRLERYEEAGAALAAATGAAAPGFFARIVQALARWMWRLFRGRAPRAASAGAGPAPGTSRLQFELRLVPAGPMAPMVEAIITPLLLPAAEDLANRILAHLEQHRAQA